ncbi:heavy metal translocating P-type ATPase [Actinoplanes couchii]|uniref:Metal-transporting ATPase n=1 Tax=Actinoplanes couchii TaxID=403638 RepID=A0ABQ3X230_9ACTN|nr:heavy metal translocating P-type ATPase [Actinoplanes couchii]MDR6316968.1 heavy metal translocating P-type ATPase [Actinoplanes couchii]GID52576.1 metal-transporting ATPase [Actinoplanes couchii]
MVAAAIGAASIGQIFDGALLIVIFATSGALEAIATRRTEESVRRLLDLAPEQATQVTADHGETVVDTADLQIGDVVLVRPGERIGADGRVLGGHSEVDQASITGEPLPVDRGPGDPVFAGTVNGTGLLRIAVEKAAADSVGARIVALVEQASATKARTQLFIEKIEQRYSIGMVAATVALFAVPLLLGAAFEPTLLRAMTLMIVASPCTVVLATMPPLLSAIATAGRHGVLVKSAVVMERLGQTSRVAFDKTGTLTEGRPHVTTIRGSLPEDELLALAAAAETGSEHPIGRAIVAAARGQGLTIPEAEAFTSAPGQGVSAMVKGRHVQVGTANGTPEEERGETAVLVRVDRESAGILGLTDRLRPESAATVTAVRDLTGTDPLLLTGDNPRAAARTASAAGIRHVRACLLPEDKIAAVRREKALLLVGDGVNDAPAMAAAHIGVAMGRSGADLTVATADAVVVRDDLSTIPAVIALSRRANRLVRANLAIAATAMAALVTWDLLSTLPLPLGVAGHEGSTILVALNGLRLLRDSAWRP